MFPRSINLLDPPSKPASKTDVVLNWILVWGRALTLICILFIVGVFTYRVIVDTKRNQLIEDVTDATERVNQVQEIQAKQIAIQSVLNQIETEHQTQKLLSNKSFFYSSYVTKASKIESLSISNENATFELVFDNLSKFKEFESSINLDPKIISTQYKLDETYSSGVPGEVKITGHVLFYNETDQITQQ
ncbi:MAG TPA: hypothetical protein PK957_01170 [Candidatus Dojkabacteria bacterium]|nr:hypothetical protein [Candidatus Dojkabacteria bacterium]HQF36440.1 hypothetical protein [Candidatus Dojkabacteria bacterium]